MSSSSSTSEQTSHQTARVTASGHPVIRSVVLIRNVADELVSRFPRLESNLEHSSWQKVRHSSRWISIWLLLWSNIRSRHRIGLAKSPSHTIFPTFSPINSQPFSYTYISTDSTIKMPGKVKAYELQSKCAFMFASRSEGNLAYFVLGQRMTCQNSSQSWRMSSLRCGFRRLLVDLHRSLPECAHCHILHAMIPF